MKEEEVSGACKHTLGDTKCIQKFWYEIVKGMDYLVEIYVSGGIILKLILKEWDVKLQTGISWLRIE